MTKKQHDEAAYIFLNANTPAYLLRHLKECDYVKALSKEPVTNLIAKLNDLVAIPSNHLATENRFEMYCHFSALSILPGKEAYDALVGLNSADRWLNMMKEIVKVKSISTTVFNFIGELQSSIQTQSNVSSRIILQ